MTYEIYAYWNILELFGVFNAIAALTASNDFTGLLRLLALVVMIALTLAVLAGRSRHEDFWRWVIMAAIVNGILLVPKTSVVLVDRTGTEPNRVVANVPIGLAALGHGISKIGDWLTRAYETVFALPTDLQFQRRGLMFGHAVLTETQLMSPDMVSGIWMKDFQEFWRECVTPDIISGYLSVDTLRTATDLWAALGGTNPARYVTLSTTGTVPCHPNAYNDLGNRLNSSVVPALVTSYGLKKFPGDPMAVTNAQNAIVAAYSYGLGIAGTAQSIVKQAAIQQAAALAYCNVFAQSGDSNRAALCYSTSMGAYQTNQTYQVLAKIAESTMPKIKSAIEIVQYAIAPIIIAFAIVAGHLALPIVKTYIMSLAWVQLWPPLYAVVHYIQTVKMQTYQAALGSAAGTFNGSDTLISMGMSDQAIAGMLVIAIPPIAAALVKGGEVGMQAVAGLLSVPRTAESQAAATAKGNETIGQFNAAPTVQMAASPTPLTSMRNADGSFGYLNPDGTSTFNAGTALDKASFAVRSSGRVSAAATTASESALSAAQQSVVSAGTELAASYQQLSEFVRAHGSGQSSGTEMSAGESATVTQAYKEAQKIASEFGQRHGLTEQKAADVLGMLYASGGFEALGTGVRASLQAAGKSSAAESIERHMGESLQQARDFTSALQRAQRVANDAKFSTGESVEARGMRSFRASMDEAMRHSQSASANLQQSLAFREVAQEIRERGISIDHDLTTRVLNRLATERVTVDGHTYNGMRREEVDYLMRQNNPTMRAIVDRIANEEAAALLTEMYGHLKTPEDVRRFFGSASQEISDDRVRAQGEAWRGDVDARARAAGVDPQSGVRNRVGSRVQQGFAGIGDALGQRENDLGLQGQAFAGGIRGQVQNPGSLLGRAASNAAESVLPEGTVYLADKVGLAPGSFAQQTAKQYQGDDKQAVIETALFGASTVLGGAGGAVVGKAIGRSLAGRAASSAAGSAASGAASAEAGGAATAAALERQAAKTVSNATRAGVVSGTIAGAYGGNRLADDPQVRAAIQGIVEQLDRAAELGRSSAGRLLGTEPRQPDSGTAAPAPSAPAHTSGRSAASADAPQPRREDGSGSQQFMFVPLDLPGQAQGSRAFLVLVDQPAQTAFPEAGASAQGAQPEARRFAYPSVGGQEARLAIAQAPAQAGTIGYERPQQSQPTTDAAPDQQPMSAPGADTRDVRTDAAPIAGMQARAPQQDVVTDAPSARPEQPQPQTSTGMGSYTAPRQQEADSASPTSTPARAVAAASAPALVHEAAGEESEPRQRASAQASSSPALRAPEQPTVGTPEQPAGAPQPQPQAQQALPETGFRTPEARNEALPEAESTAQHQQRPEPQAQPPVQLPAQPQVADHAGAAQQASPQDIVAWEYQAAQSSARADATRPQPETLRETQQPPQPQAETVDHAPALTQPGMQPHSTATAAPGPFQGETDGTRDAQAQRAPAPGTLDTIATGSSERATPRAEDHPQTLAMAQAPAGQTFGIPAREDAPQLETHVGPQTATALGSTAAAAVRSEAQPDTPASAEPQPQPLGQGALPPAQTQPQQQAQPEAETLPFAQPQNQPNAAPGAVSAASSTWPEPQTDRLGAAQPQPQPVQDTSPGSAIASTDERQVLGQPSTFTIAAATAQDVAEPRQEAQPQRQPAPIAPEAVVATALPDQPASPAELQQPPLTAPQPAAWPSFGMPESAAGAPVQPSSQAFGAAPDAQLPLGGSADSQPAAGGAAPAFTDTPGRSNLARMLTDDRRVIVVQQQVERPGGQPKEDMPPPSGR